MAYKRYKMLQKYVNGEAMEEYKQGELLSELIFQTLEECNDGNLKPDEDIEGEIYEWRRSSETMCNDVNKYYVDKEYVSYDEGQSWNETGRTRQGDLLEVNSADCTNVIYRWVVVTGAYICYGADKYAKEKEQQSNDNGVSWFDTGSTRQGALIQSGSIDCERKCYMGDSTDGYRIVETQEDFYEYYYFQDSSTPTVYEMQIKDNGTYNTVAFVTNLSRALYSPVNYYYIDDVYYLGAKKIYKIDEPTWSSYRSFNNEPRSIEQIFTEHHLSNNFIPNVDFENSMFSIGNAMVQFNETDGVQRIITDVDFELTDDVPVNDVTVILHYHYFCNNSDFGTSESVNPCNRYYTIQETQTYTATENITTANITSLNTSVTGNWLRVTALRDDITDNYNQIKYQISNRPLSERSSVVQLIFSVSSKIKIRFWITFNNTRN